MLISIITPSFNRAGLIGDAIASVLAQDYPHVEHIIVDGGSTDGTLERLKRYPQLEVISEPDRGMYDAINKGLAIARGEVIGFLNTDDAYAPKVFAEMMPLFDDPAVLAVAGGAAIYALDAHNNRQNVAEFHPDRTALIDSVTLGSPFFNGWLFRARVFDLLGKFDTRYRIVADREFMLRFALSALPYKIFDGLVYFYRQHPGALTFVVDDAKFKQIVDEHLMLIETCLQNGLPPEVERNLRALYARDTTDMFLRALKARNIPLSLTYMLAGLRRDLFWGIHPLRRLATRLGR